ncbi:phage tail protein [Niallia nealsonii]|uniref:Uncharacterized protein n=1 Tax=Niallia nealsonii TaxID=115979 RepID=A0A2N0Z365_9BACI|nr:phage tail protein [Niallia nealsonii]PKG23950.1 hypothetical protein CWS01_09280 [Niallia nealsonii]
MDLYIKSLTGQIEMLTNYEVARKFSEDGKKQITVSITKTENNLHSFPLVINENILMYGEDQYVIKQHAESTVGKSTSINCTAVHKMFEDFNHNYIYEQITGTYSISSLLEFAAAGTGYSFIVDTTDLKSEISVENFGDGNTQNLFKTIQDLFGVEFDVRGTNIYIGKEVGDKTDYQFRYLLNIDGPQKEIDTSSLKTYIRAFGQKYSDGTYVAQTEYTSPLAAVYGIRHADPIRDDQISDNDTLLEQCKSTLTDSIEMFIKLTATEIKELGWKKVNRGDYVWCIIDPFDLFVYIRVVEIEDYSNKYKDAVYTFGAIKNDAKKIIANFNKSNKVISTVIDTTTKKVKDTALSSNVKSALSKANSISDIVGDITILPSWAQESLAYAVSKMYDSFTEINVKQPPYNLSGNSANEMAKLQSLFDLARDNGSVYLYFPEGIYGMSGYLRLYSNTFVRMHNKATIKRLGSGYKVFVNGELGNANYATGYNGEGNIHFVGGCIDCNAFENPLSAEKGTTAFDLSHGKNISFTGVEMKNNQNGHFVQVASCSNVLFNGCYIHDVNHLDSEYMNCEAIQIEVATDVSFPSFGGYDSTTSQNIRIIDCNFENLIRGIGTHGYPAAENGLPSIYCSDIVIERCQFKNIVDNAISLLAYKRVTVQNVHVEDIGGYALWTRYLYDSSIDKFSCDHTGKSGIYMQYSDDIEFGKLTLENTCENEGYSAIRLDNAHNNVFRNPVVKGSAHNWAFFATACENNRLYDYNFDIGIVGMIGGDSLPLSPSFSEIT